MSTNEAFSSVVNQAVRSTSGASAPATARIRTVLPTLHVQRISAQVRITPQARVYAIHELARRAGVPREFQNQWTIQVEAGETIVTLEPGSEKKIIFPHAAPDLLRELSAGRIRTVRRRWMNPPADGREGLVPDFVVPFAKDKDTFPRPLFLARGSRIECTVDLPLSILMTLSRWEETLGREADVHGRFPARQSVAFRDGFLDRPIVDEYAFAFEQVVQALYPGWQPPDRQLRIKLSHDADHIGIPFRWKDTIRQTTQYRRPLNSARDVLGLLTDAEPSNLRALREIVKLSMNRRLDSAVYWKASQASARDSGYDPRDPKVRAIIAWLTENEVECGVQPGYETFRAPEKLRREIQILREAIGDRPLGGRQHYLRWSPETWIHWETCGLVYDSSVCFAEHIGFRAGTCIPYRPWLFPLNRPAELLEIPLLVMDRTLVGYMGLSDEASVEAVSSCLARCRAVGGVFTLVWHNNNLLDPQFNPLYLKLLPLFAGGRKYDWAADYTPGSAR